MLETQESGDAIPVRARRLERRTANSLSVISYRWLRSMTVNQREWFPLLCLIFYLKLQWHGEGQPIGVWGGGFALSSDSCSNVIHRCPHRHIQKNVWADFWTAIVKASWPMKWNITASCGNYFLSHIVLFDMTFFMQKLKAGHQSQLKMNEEEVRLFPLCSFFGDAD